MLVIENKIDFNIENIEIEKRKTRIRKIWNYEKVDHVPLGLFAIDNKEGFSRQEMEKEKEKNLRFDLNSVKKSLQLFPDDYIPFVKPEVGCCTIPTILGSEIKFTEGFSNFSTVREPLVLKIGDLSRLHIPESKAEIMKLGLMPLNLEKIHYYFEVTRGAIDTTGFDIGGVLCGSVDIMESSLFYMSLVTDKEKMTDYLEKISTLYIAVQEILIGEVGDVNKMTTIDWDVSWYPEGRKGYVSDDPCANFGPDTFEIFSKPYNGQMYDRFGYGGFHNCGPHPCASRYIDYTSGSLKAINCSLQHTLKELDTFMDNFIGGEILLYFLFEEEFYDAASAVRLYKMLAEKGAARNIVCIPSYPLDAQKYSDSQIKDIYAEFLKISQEYASVMKLKLC